MTQLLFPDIHLLRHRVKTLLVAKTTTQLRNRLESLALHDRRRGIVNLMTVTILSPNLTFSWERNQIFHKS